jgi:SurA N-terminal domain/PPIC-type PPIASE domain
MRFSFRTLSLAVLAAAAVACGGSSSSSSLQSGDVAVVDTQHITKTQLAHEIAIALHTMKAQHTPVPKAGTAAYQSQVIDQSLAQLVFADQIRLVAQQLGVSVTHDAVQKRLDAAIKKAYNGDRAKYLAAIKKYGITDQDVLAQFEVIALEQAIQHKLEAEQPVNDQTAKAYYDAHRSQYTVSDDTRKVNYILLPSKAAAAKDLGQLNAGKPEAQVAKGAIDSDALHTPAQPLTATGAAGSLEENFQRAALTLPTGKWGAPVPVSASYASTQLKGKCKPTCYFLIRPVDDLVKKGTQQSFASVKAQILSTLKSGVQAQHVQQRVQALINGIKKKTKYAPSYAPPPSSTSPATTSPTTT